MFSLYGRRSPKISVANVNGEDIYLEEVMALRDRLPADLRQQPMETYFDRLVDDIIDSVWPLQQVMRLV